ncbi:hypothetical protein [Reyranella sp.]|uniref:hypothetical protein n=1 Tax=Reyranella sp. TaxID=1929291 RepID=UPI003D0B7392
MNAEVQGELTTSRTLKAEMVFVPGGVDAILDRITAEVRSISTDISTPAGRSAVASLAYKVARSKTALDDMGKQLVADWKQKAAVVDADRRRIREALDALRDEVRKPLDEWEAADRRRIAAHEAALEEMRRIGVFDADATATEIDGRLAAMENLPARDWQEFQKRADDMRSATLATLTRMRDAAAKREAERAELERLRREQAEREQKERDARIAAEAAEKARIAAEKRAEAEAKAAAEKAERERRRVEDEKRRAEEKAEAAERARVLAEARAREEAEATAKRVEAEKRAAAEKAERERVAAIEAERQRQAAEKAEEEAAAAKRAADKKHRAAINNEIVASLIGEAAIEREQAVAVVTAIAQGKVPHTRIAY